MSESKPKSCPEPAWPGCPPHHEHREFEFTWRPLPHCRKCHPEPKPCPTVLDFVGEALAHLTNADNLDVPADVRGARAVRVLSELATRLEHEQR